MIDHQERKAYRIDEVAAFFGVSTKTIRRRISSGELKSMQVGRCVRIPAHEVDRFAGREPSTAA